MEYKGVVRDGVIVLDSEQKPVEGSRVSVFISDSMPKPTGEPKKSLREFLLSVSGICKEGPEDGSVQHDHYIYGTPKR